MPGSCCDSILRNCLYSKSTAKSPLAEPQLGELDQESYFEMPWIACQSTAKLTLFSGLRTRTTKVPGGCTEDRCSVRKGHLELMRTHLGPGKVRHVNFSRPNSHAVPAIQVTACLIECPGMKSDMKTNLPSACWALYGGLRLKNAFQRIILVRGHWECQ
jgi:hypothetical protein